MSEDELEEKKAELKKALIDWLIREGENGRKCRPPIIRKIVDKTTIDAITKHERGGDT